MIRVKCPHASVCSGCTQIRDVYAKQLANKKRALQALLDRYLSPQTHFPSILASPKITEYRTTGKLCLHQDNKGNKAIGLYKRSTQLVIDIPKCQVHHPLINEVVEKIFRKNNTIPFEFYNHTKKTFQANCLRYITVRINPQSQEACLIVSHTGVPTEQLSAWLTPIIPSRISVFESLLTPSDGANVIGAKINHLHGKPLFHFSLAGIDFQLHPGAFFQANNSLWDQFVTTIIKDLRGEVLCDLYGGFGAYSIPLHNEFKKIYLIDGNGYAIESAKSVCQTLKISNVLPIRTFCEPFLEHRLKINDKKQVDHIIVNPPRNGLSAQVKKFLNQDFFPTLKSITYVSCNPITLKHDLKHLLASGKLRLELVQGFDMFPLTDHVETVVKIGLNKKQF